MPLSSNPAYCLGSGLRRSDMLEGWPLAIWPVLKVAKYQNYFFLSICLSFISDLCDNKKKKLRRILKCNILLDRHSDIFTLFRTPVSPCLHIHTFSLFSDSHDVGLMSSFASIVHTAPSSSAPSICPVHLLQCSL